MKKLYRSEIDGLRGISVVAVVFYHTGLNLFKNGYLGVDVFFVISGYLITNIIISSHDEGNFSYLNFFERRARRILPLLLFISAVSIPFAWYLLSAELLQNYGQSLVSITLFASNILFFLTTWDYFGLAAELKPLIHTWSLAVEEQFYIIFPVILIFFLNFYRKYLILFLISIIIFSFYIGYNEDLFVFDIKNSNLIAGKSWTSFYLLPGRVWELMLGSFAAVLLKKKDIKSNNFLSIFGLSLIIFSLIFNIVTSNNYVLKSFFPSFGTLLIILFAGNNSIIKKVLSYRFLVLLGLISYGIYLWHQPIFSLIRIYNNNSNLNIYTSLFLVILVIGLSYLSWKYIETPNRSKNKVNTYNFIKRILLMYGVILIFGLFFHLSDGAYKLEKYKKLYPNIEFDRDKSIKNYFKYLSKESNNFSDKMNENKIKIFIVGDSMAQDLFMALDQQPNLNKKYSFAHIMVPYISNWKNISDNFKSADVVIVTYSQAGTVSDEKELKSIINFFKKHKKTFYLTTVSPIFNVIGDEPFIATMHKWHLNNNFKIKKDQIEKSIFKFIKHKHLEKNKLVINQYKKMNINYLNKLDYICPKYKKQKCPGVTDQFENIYFDGSHTTIEGAKYFGDIIYKIKWLEKIKFNN